MAVGHAVQRLLGPDEDSIPSGHSSWGTGSAEQNRNVFRIDRRRLRTSKIVRRNTTAGSRKEETENGLFLLPRKVRNTNHSDTRIVKQSENGKIGMDSSSNGTGLMAQWGQRIDAESELVPSSQRCRGGSVQSNGCRMTAASERNSKEGTGVPPNATISNDGTENRTARHKAAQDGKLQNGAEANRGSKSGKSPYEADRSHGPERPSAATGRRGEETAALWLRREGYDICARNWRSGRYELDIIARKQNCLHFVEVKTRRADGLTPPEQALTPAKCRALVRAAALYMAEHESAEEPRFDLAAVDMQPDGNAVVRFIPDAVESHW